MKLSIIVPIYKESRLITRFLDQMQRQELQDFELVLVIDTNNENILGIVDEYKKFFKKRLALIYNTKRMGRTIALYEGVKKSQSDYLLICSASDIVLRDGIKELINLIVERNNDIIEFIPRMRSPIRFKGYLRQNFFKTINLNEDPSPIAYTFPFDFNKIFKREILLKALAQEESNKNVNTRFAITYVLRAFYYAQTYSNIAKKIIRSKLNNTLEISPLIIARQWENFRASLAQKHENKFIQEFDYLSFYHQVVILTSFLGVLNRKSLINKYQKYLEKQIEQYFAKRIDTNKYFLLDNNETRAFRAADNFYAYSKLLKNLR